MCWAQGMAVCEKKQCLWWQDRSRVPVVPPLPLGNGLLKLNSELRAAWDDALAKVLSYLGPYLHFDEY